MSSPGLTAAEIAHRLEAKRMQDRIRAGSEAVTESGCWIWFGALTKDGYGRIGVGPRRSFHVELSHRASYAAFRGRIPLGLTLDHLCRVRCCVNPDHLEAVTNRENTLRGDTVAAHHSQKTFCPNGHSLIDGNLNPWHAARGWRACLECRRASARRRGRS